MDLPRDSDAPWLSARNVCKDLGATPVLKGCSADVRRADSLAITGSSGSGKTTLLHCLSGVLVPDSGTVTFRGHDVGSQSDDARSRLRRRDFGYVFQFGHLVAELSVLENVALPLMLDGVDRVRARSRASAVLGDLGVGDLVRRRPGEISGGQVQRVAIARAMVIEPSVLFADEPTGSLDSAASEVVLAALERITVDHGTSLIIVTHDPDVAARTARTIHVDDGVTAGHGTPSWVL